MKATNRTQTSIAKSKAIQIAGQQPRDIASKGNTASDSSAERPTGFEGYKVLADGSLKLRNFA
jgi:hypothetical protein